MSVPAVGKPDLSTEAVHRPSPLPEPFPAVFPVVHTLYDYDERF